MAVKREIQEAVVSQQDTGKAGSHLAQSGCVVTDL